LIWYQDTKKNTRWFKESGSSFWKIKKTAVFYIAHKAGYNVQIILNKEEKSDISYAKKALSDT